MFCSHLLFPLPALLGRLLSTLGPSRLKSLPLCEVGKVRGQESTDWKLSPREEKQRVQDHTGAEGEPGSQRELGRSSSRLSRQRLRPFPICPPPAKLCTYMPCTFRFGKPQAGRPALLSTHQVLIDLEGPTDYSSLPTALSSAPRAYCPTGPPHPHPSDSSPLSGLLVYALRPAGPVSPLSSFPDTTPLHLLCDFLLNVSLSR